MLDGQTDRQLKRSNMASWPLPYGSWSNVYCKNPHISSTNPLSPTITDNRWMHFDNVWEIHTHTHLPAQTNMTPFIVICTTHAHRHTHTQHTQIPTNRMRQILIWRFAFKFKTELLLPLLKCEDEGRAAKTFRLNDWLSEWRWWVVKLFALRMCLLITIMRTMTHFLWVLFRSRCSLNCL